jgi:transposase
MGHLTDDTKYKIIHEYQDCRNITTVANRVKVDRKTVRRWILRFTETGGVAKKHGGGPKRVVSASAAKLAVDLLLSGEHAGLQAVGRELHDKGHTSRVVHKSTIRRQAKAAAVEQGTPIRCVSGKPKRRLSQFHRSKRYAFSKANLSRNWFIVMMSDRKRFLFSYPGEAVGQSKWIKKGEVWDAATVNHPQCVNLYMGITPYGATEPYLVAGTSKLKTTDKNQKGETAKNITYEEYRKVLTHCLLPQGSKLMTNQGITYWYLQQDNDPSHKKAAKEVVQEWNAKNHSQVTILPEWPPNSPDLNLIENVWGILQARVYATKCNTFEEFQETVIRECKQLDKKLLAKLHRSMRARVQKCYAEMGGKTGY